jgi:hypothetical protein
MQTIPAKITMLGGQLTISQAGQRGRRRYVLSLTEARLDNQCHRRRVGGRQRSEGQALTD